ncbi:hypothetical protein MKEN_01033600 [Mycena kentingensis (nom. inval.)]|nr:hypothetical protein MKEN_01033600 [Mycena kentingensis (nom. inval.)]
MSGQASLRAGPLPPQSDDYSRLYAAYQELQTQYELSSGVYDTLRERYEEIRIREDDLRLREDALESRKQQMKEELSTFNAQAMLTLEAAETRVKDAEDDLGVATREKADLEQKLRRAERDADTAGASLATVRRDKITLQTKTSQLEEQLRSRTAEAAIDRQNAAAELTAAQSNARDLQSSLATVNAQLQQKVSEIAELKSKLAAAASGRETAESQSARVESVLKASREEVRSLRAELAASQRSSVTGTPAPNDNNNSAAERDAAHAELEQCKTELRLAQKALRKEKSERNQLDKELAVVTDKKKKQAFEFTAMKIRLNALSNSATNNEIARRNTELEQQIAPLAQRIKDLETRNNELQTTNTNLQNGVLAMATGVKEEVEKGWKEKVKLLETRLGFVNMADPDNFRSSRAMYNAVMRAYPVPPGRRPYRDLETIQMTATVKTQLLNPEKWHWTRRHYLYLPKRTTWCETQDKVHLLGFASTMYYKQHKDEWVDNEELVSKCGREYELFVTNSEDEVRYVGVYRVNSLRIPDGSEVSGIPPDVSDRHVFNAMGLYNDALVESSNVEDQFPDSDGEVQVECFGLQCVGFDEELYRVLQRKWEQAEALAGV